MIKFLKKHWTGMVIAALALWILREEFYAALFYKRLMPSAIENSFFVATGTWSIRFLLLSLLMSPIYAFTSWRFPLKLRKPLGLVAFGFVAVHAYLHLSSKFTSFENYNLWERINDPSYVLYGAIAFGILALMAATSIKPTMKLMGRWWKPLHRLVYVAGVLIMLHIILAVVSPNSKRYFAGGEEALVEYKIYLVALLVLLVLRIPLIKHSLQRVIPFAPNPRKAKEKRALASI